MSEWWTYSLSDFLMFAPRTYWRLVALYNADLWPAHFVAFAGGLGALVLAVRTRGSSQRILAALLAIAWGWVGWGWLHLRFAAINWAADYAAAAFAFEAAALLALAARRDGLGTSARTSPAGRALAVFAVAGYPFVAPLAGRGMGTTDMVGLMPDPTALLTIALAVSAPITVRWVLLPVPLAWCATSGAMLWTMDERGWWLLPGAALLALLAPRLAARRYHSTHHDDAQRSNPR